MKFHLLDHLLEDDRRSRDIYAYVYEQFNFASKRYPESYLERKKLVYRRHLFLRNGIKELSSLELYLNEDYLWNCGTEERS